jgi:hypothetical protein
MPAIGAIGVGLGTLSGLESAFVPSTPGVGIGGGLLGQHQVPAFDGPRNGQRPIDARQVVANDSALRAALNDHDANATIHTQSSSTASRPAAGIAGRKWVTQDDGIALHWYDTGSTWVAVAGDWLTLVNRPSTFPPAPHSADLITSGTLAVERLASSVPLRTQTNNFTARQLFNAGAESIAVGGEGTALDHVSIGFFPRTASPGTRWASFGFLSSGATTLELSHLQTGNIALTTNGRSVTFRSDGAFELSSTRALRAGSRTYVWPSADGTSGQTLTTDGSGVLSWVTPSGGGGGGSVDWTAITGRPSTFAPSAHTHPPTDVSAGTFGAGVLLPAAQVSAGVFGAGVVLSWASLSGVPATFTPATHTQDWSTITGRPAAFPSDWSTLASRPATFPPSLHRHGWTELDNIPATFPPSAHTQDWSTVTGRPATFPPSAHAHTIADVAALQAALDAKATRGAPADFNVLTVNGVPTATLIVSEAAPSGVAAQGTLWVQI